MLIDVCCHILFSIELLQFLLKNKIELTESRTVIWETALCVAKVSSVSDL